MARPRSKTFEEYEKETDDIWNDGSDLNALKFDEAELEFVAEEGGEEDIAVKKRMGGGKGKGRGEPTEVDGMCFFL